MGNFSESAVASDEYYTLYQGIEAQSLQHLVMAHLQQKPTLSFM